MINADRVLTADLDRAARSLRAAVAAARSLGATLADIDRFVADGIADAGEWTSTQTAIAAIREITARTGYRPSSAPIPPTVDIPPPTRDELSPALRALADWKPPFDRAA